MAQVSSPVFESTVDVGRRAGRARPEHMSDRARWLAALNGQPVDHLPFWAKLDGSYAPFQAAPFRQMNTAEMHAYVGSVPPQGIGAALKITRAKTGFERQADGLHSVERFLTPTGVLERECRFDPISCSWHPTQFPVTDVASLERMADWYDDQQVELDADGLATARARAAEVGAQECGITSTNIGISPLMDFIQHLANLDQAQYLLIDHPAAVERLLAAMGRVILARAQRVAETSPADLIFMIENTSTTLISPRQYRQYCRPILQEIARIVHAHGKRLCLHMCGFLRKLLPDLATVGADAFEATTSPPVGDTRLIDARTGCPQVSIIGGTNATLWTGSGESIMAEIRADLDALPDTRRLVVSSAGVMTPLCKPDTIRQVAEFVQSYPVR